MKNIDGFEVRQHALNRMLERCIEVEWVQRTLRNPEFKRRRRNGRIHFLRRIPEYGNHYLRVVVDGRHQPRRIVTVYFDSNPINLS